MTDSPFPAYCVIDNPLDPLVCRDLPACADAIIRSLRGRKVRMTDDLLVWGDQPDDQRISIGVHFIVEGQPAETGHIEESRIILTGNGEQSISLKAEIRRQLALRKVAA